MRIGLIATSALNGEHYYNLLEAVMDGRLSEIVTCDSNTALRPVDMPQFKHCYTFPPGGKKGKNLKDRVDWIQMMHHMHKNHRGAFPRFYEDYAAMLEAEKLDGVIIGTPNYLHAEMAVATLSRRIPTLLEKPMAPTLAEVDQILAAARDHDTLLQIGLGLRWRKVMQFVREQIEAGAIGEMKMAWGREFRGDWKKEPATLAVEGAAHGNWRFSQRHTGGSMMEKICHDLDALYWLIGAEPVKAVALGGTDFVDDGRDTIDNASFLVEYANGVRLNFELCMAAPYAGRFKGRWFGFIGTKGMLDVDEAASEVRLYESNRSSAISTFTNLDPPTLPGHHKGNVTVVALADFLTRIERGEKKAKHDPEDNRATTKLIMALEESLRRGGEMIQLAAFDPE